MRAILEQAGIPVVGLDAFAPIAVPEETEDTFKGNSLLKALYYAKHTGSMCLADDSGLEVDALDGRPGVYSARFAELADGTYDWLFANLDGSAESKDERNNILLLYLLRYDQARRSVDLFSGAHTL